LVFLGERKTEIITMSNQNQPDEGSKADVAMRKLNRQDEIKRQAEKEQDEKIKNGGTDEITTKEGDSFIDGMPGYG
jgi:hypothetical protein